MCKKIEMPIASEFKCAIHFLNAKDIKPTEIHHQIWYVDRDEATSVSVAGKRVSLFNKGRENVHNDGRSRWLSLTKDNMIFFLLKRRLTENR